MKVTGKRRHVLQALQRRRRLIISAAIIGLLIFVLLPQTNTLWHSLDIVRQASPGLVVLAICLTFLVYALAAEMYHMLVKYPIPLRTVATVQMATALTARIAPVGVGTMGLNTVFLNRQKHTLPEALAVVTVYNGISGIVHLILLAVFATTAPLPASASFNLTWSAAYWTALVIAIVIIVFAWSDKLRNKIATAVRKLIDTIAGYRNRRRALALVLLVSITQSIVYVLVLMACAQALGVVIPFNQIFLIYTFSLFTGLLTATPGGLVGVEAGLVTGFVAYGVASETALAVALLYRLVTYWLPLLPGFIAFRVVQHKYF